MTHSSRPFSAILIISTVVVAVTGASLFISRSIVNAAISKGAPLAEQRKQQRDLEQKSQEQQKKELEHLRSLTQLLHEVEEKLNDKPNDSMLVISAANLAYDIKDFSKAERYYKHFLSAVAPGNIPAQIDLAYVEFQLGRTDDALGMIRRIADHHPQNQTALYNAAYLYTQMGKQDSVRYYLELCIQADPTSEAGVNAQKVLTSLKNDKTTIN